MIHSAEICVPAFYDWNYTTCDWGVATDCPPVGQARAQSSVVWCCPKSFNKFVAAAAVVEAHVQPGGEKTAATNAALEAFKQ